MEEPRIDGVLLETLPQVEQRCSAEVKQNAKGEPSVSCKAYSNDLAALEPTAREAIRVYKIMVAEVGA